MPASTLDPGNAVIGASSTKINAESDLETQLSNSRNKILWANFTVKYAGNNISAFNEQVLSTSRALFEDDCIESEDEEEEEAKTSKVVPREEDTLKLPSRELYPMESVKLGWGELPDWSAGCGMINMGNTCYLNSTLQALFHVPAFANWLISDREHYSSCYESGYCIICSMRRTLLESQNTNMNAIRPIHIYNKLRSICRNFILNRQEDAHEFFKHLIEAMEKSYLCRFNDHGQFDPRLKETTPLNQIFGGYLRSAVTCLDCGHISTSFQHFQDLLLDIRKAQTIEDAVAGYFSIERIDDDSYHCESCRKKVSANKQFSLERAPLVLCVQLKRFSVSNTKINRQIEFKLKLDLTKFKKNRSSTPLVYRLVSIVTHIGSSVHCGHYTAIGSIPSGSYYQFDDSNARPISQSAVVNTGAYILMYELESSSHSRKNLLPKVRLKTAASTEACSSSSTPISNGIAYINNKVYGPALPENGLIKRNHDNSSIGPKSTEEDSVKHSVNGSNFLQTSQNTPTKIPLPLVTIKPSDQIVPIKSYENDKGNCSAVSSDKTPKKLAPHKEDNSGSEGSSPLNKFNNDTASDARNGGWKITPVEDPFYESAKRVKWTENGSHSDKVLNQLYKTTAYSSVSTWNGTRSRLDKEVSNERREERKRTINAIATDEPDRKKHNKTHNNFKSNPGYHPIEEYHSSKNWNHRHNNSNLRFYGNKPFFKNAHRYRPNFHHKNYHNKHGRM